jgi:cytochrome c-type biogenesis protein CcmH/NrfG
MRKRNTTCGAVLVVGASLALSLGACRRSEERLPAAPLPVAPPAAMPPAAPPGMAPGSPVPAPGQIAALEQAAAKDPKNARAWTQLGDAYFDSHQPGNAVDAYGKALALDPNNPNVLTDQGVMYRELGQYQKALANFEKASQIDPSHIQSIFNIGVVYATNLNQPEKAIQAWNRVIQMAPASPQAAQARQLIEAQKAAGAR